MARGVINVELAVSRSEASAKRQAGHRSILQIRKLFLAVSPQPFEYRIRRCAAFLFVTIAVPGVRFAETAMRAFPTDPLHERNQHETHHHLPWRPAGRRRDGLLGTCHEMDAPKPAS